MDTLKGREIYSQLRILPTNEPLLDKNAEEYWRMSRGKTVFIIREGVKNDFEAANIAEINLEEDSRELEVDGKVVSAKTLSYAGHLTYVQAKAIVRNEGELTQLENTFKVPIAAKIEEMA